MSKNNSHSPSGEMSAGGCLVRLFWLVFGHMALFFSAIYIWQNQVRFLSRPDFVFWGIVLFLILVRCLDIRVFKGLTMKGDAPATISQWRRYVLVLLAISVLLWGAAHGLAWLSR